ncbi:hypothetical protein OAO16_02225 [Opitutales bacterium]|nr:hypothetical protein [Opitutales bacterium]
MRVPNLSVSTNVTETISKLNQQRITLDQQISSGQRISLPEDDGMTMGRVIDIETQKSTLTQYQRNASYASEFLNTGYLNLDKLREVNVRGQEIARASSTGLSGAATETYGQELNQLIEEVLNRLNASHRKRSIFGGTQLKPEFDNSEIKLGQKEKKEISFPLNQVGFVQNNGTRSINKGEQIVLELNGREYIVESKRDNLSLTEVNDALSYLINYDKGELSDSPSIGEDSNPNVNLKGSVRSSQDNWLSRNDRVDLSSEVSLNGNLQIFGSTGETFDANATYVHRWNPNLYFPKQIEDQLSKETENRFPGLSFDELTESEKDLVQFAVFSKDRLKEIFDREAQSIKLYTEALDNELSNILADPARSSEFLQNTSRIASDYENKKYLDLDAADQAKVREELFLPEFELKNLFTQAELDEGTDNTKTLASLSADERTAIEAKVLSRNWISNELDRESQLRFQKPFDEISQNEQDNIRTDIFTGYISRELTVDSSSVNGNSTIDINHAGDWRRLEIYERGDIIKFEGKLFESKIENNRNHIPSSTGSDYWRELESGYATEREDWKIENVGQKTVPYYMCSDGKLFSSKQDANDHTLKNITPLLFDANSPSPSVTKVFLSVDDYNASGSESGGLVTFDPETLEYRLSSVSDGGNVFQGEYFKGTHSKTSDPNYIENDFTQDQVIQHEGRYYLITDPENADQATWPYLQANFPPSGVIHSYEDGGATVDMKAGEYVLHSDKYYVATDTVSIASADDLSKVELKLVSEHTDGSSFLLDKLPVQGEEIHFDGTPLTSVKRGQYISIDSDGGQENKHYVALEDVTGPVDPTDPANSDKFKSISVSIADQGKEWSYDTNYEHGQIVYFEGKYFERIDYTGQNFVGIPVPGEPGSSVVSPIPIKPNDEFISDPVYDEDDSLIRVDLKSNDRWREIDDFGKPLNHVLKFKSLPDSVPSLTLPDAGRAGVSAEARPIIDANGNISGIKLENPGRYFFGVDQDGAAPPSFRKISILLDDGRKTEADIIWGQDTSDPGAYKIAGFSINQLTSSGITHTYNNGDNVTGLEIEAGDKIHDVANDRFYIANNGFVLSDKVSDDGQYKFHEINELVDFISDLPHGSDTGDTFTFSTGTKTFLEHRNENGDITGVTYKGSTKNSEFSIGKDSKVSAFLSAEDDGTKQLATTLESLVTIRDGLLSSNPLSFSKEMEEAEKTLISHEDVIINQMGEITSNIVRMDTAKAHDEEYFMELDKRISRDVDIDLSEAIMRLTQISTAYQASLQIGSQLLNTSLLNYL